MFECSRVFSKLNVIGILDLEVGCQHVYMDIMGWPNREGVNHLSQGGGPEIGTPGIDEMHLVEIVLVQLPDERDKVGVLERAGKDGVCELIHVLSKGASAGK